MHLSKYIQKPKEGVKSPGPGITKGCELPNMGAGLVTPGPSLY